MNTPELSDHPPDETGESGREQSPETGVAEGLTAALAEPTADKKKADTEYGSKHACVGEGLPNNGAEDLEERVKDLEDTLAAWTETPEPTAHVNVAKAVELGKETVGNINEAIRPGQRHTVDAQLLRSFIDDVVLEVVRRVGAETIGAAANEVLRDPSSRKKLSTLTTDRPRELTGLGDQVTGDITPSDGADRPELSLLVLAGALLLAAGVVLPLIPAAIAAETILTNEVAIAAVTVSVAALMKHS